MSISTRTDNIAACLASLYNASCSTHSYLTSHHGGVGIDSSVGSLTAFRSIAVIGGTKSLKGVVSGIYPTVVVLHGGFRSFLTTLTLASGAVSDCMTRSSHNLNLVHSVAKRHEEHVSPDSPMAGPQAASWLQLQRIAPAWIIHHVTKCGKCGGDMERIIRVTWLLKS
jgi:hypothetical protein